MDLWIRSQDRKRLVPNPNLYVVYSKESQCAYVGGYFSWTYRKI